MKLLLDACVWGGTRGELVVAGHDVVWAGDWLQDPGDEEIMARAAQEGRILMTLDKDFGKLAIVMRQGPLRNRSNRQHIGKTSGGRLPRSTGPARKRT